MAPEAENGTAGGGIALRSLASKGLLVRDPMPVDSWSETEDSMPGAPPPSRLWSGGAGLGGEISVADPFPFLAASAAASLSCRNLSISCADIVGIGAFLTPVRAEATAAEGACAGDDVESTVSVAYLK